MTKQMWTIDPHTGVDKHFIIQGPDGFQLWVDYDDVDHEFQDLMAAAVVEHLNNFWSIRTLVDIARRIGKREDTDA